MAHKSIKKLFATCSQHLLDSNVISAPPGKVINKMKLFPFDLIMEDSHLRCAQIFRPVDRREYFFYTSTKYALISQYFTLIPKDSFDRRTNQRMYHSIEYLRIWLPRVLIINKWWNLAFIQSLLSHPSLYFGASPIAFDKAKGLKAKVSLFCTFLIYKLQITLSFPNVSAM